MRFHQPSLRLRLALLLGGFTAGMGLILLLNFRMATEVTEELSDLRRSFPQYAYADQINHSVDKAFNLFDTLVLTGQPSLLEQFENESRTISTLTSRLAAGLADGERAKVLQFQVRFAKYHAKATQLASTLASRSGWDASLLDEGIAMSLTEVTRLKIPLKEASVDLIRNQRNLLDQSLFSIFHRIERQSFNAFLLALITVIATVAILARLAKRIIDPIRSLSGLAAEVAQGRLDQDCGPTQFGNDELGRLARSFQKMIEGLRSTTVSRDTFDSINQSMADTLVVTDLAGTITMVNRAAIRLLGYEGDELLGRPLDTILEDRKEEDGVSIDEIIERGSVRKEIQYRTRSGDRVPVLFSSAVFGKDTGNPGLVCVAQDISARREVEAILRKTKEDAEAANQAKSDFLAKMSHEIRTPMNGVLGMTQLLQATRLTGEQSGYVSTISHCGDALLNVINDILDLSKIEAGQFELEELPFDLRDSLESTLEILTPKAWEKEIELNLFIEESVPRMLIGDPGRLRQVIINLLNNAIRFTSEGEVLVEVKSQPIDHDRGEAEIHFSVVDDGVGIPPEKLEIIFDPFRQADGSVSGQYGGTGLGLAICRQLVGLFGGRIWAESEPGHGSRFRFTACFKVQDSSRADSDSVPPTSDVLTGLRTIVVDDNETNRRILDQILRDWGMNPVLVSRGLELMSCLVRGQEDGEPFDIVFLDSDLGDSDGFSLAREIKQIPSLRRTKLVMLSSRGQRGEGRQCRELGISAYLTKPFRQSLLLQTLLTVAGRNAPEGASPTSPADGADPLITRHTLRARPENLRLLVAEDNPVNQTVIRTLLEKHGVGVTVVENGTLAVEAFKRRPFDLILMDFEMPVMDGLEATRIIRAIETGRSTRIPIVAMTARAMKEDRDRCLEAGMDDYLSKPIKIDQLWERITKLTEPVITDAGISNGEGGTVDGEDSPPVVAGSDIVEDGVFDETRALGFADGDPELLDTLIDLFLKEYPEIVQEIDRLDKAFDTEALRKLGHKVKGMVSTLGAERAEKAARKLELSDPGPDPEGVPAEGGELIQELDSLAERLRNRKARKAA